MARDETSGTYPRILDGPQVSLIGDIATMPMGEALLAQLKTGIAHEEENFQRLIDGSDVSPEEVRQKALHVGI